MKSVLMIILSTFLLVSCAHSDMKSAKHSCQKTCKMHGEKGEAFNKHCAMAVSRGNMSVAGKNEYKLEHKGETYYFSSKAMMEEFNKDKELNISKAKEFWVVPSQEI
jgi:YHS domain-containing protein